MLIERVPPYTEVSSFQGVNREGSTVYRGVLISEDPFINIVDSFPNIAKKKTFGFLHHLLRSHYVDVSSIFGVESCWNGM